MKSKYMEIKGIPGFYGRLFVKDDRIIEVVKNLTIQYPNAGIKVIFSAPH